MGSIQKVNLKGKIVNSTFRAYSSRLRVAVTDILRTLVTYNNTTTHNNLYCALDTKVSSHKK